MALQILRYTYLQGGGSRRRQEVWQDTMTMLTRSLFTIDIYGREWSLKVLLTREAVGSIPGVSLVIGTPNLEVYIRTGRRFWARAGSVARHDDNANQIIVYDRYLWQSGA